MKIKEVISELYQGMPLKSDLTKYLFAIEDIKFKHPFITKDIYSDLDLITVEKPLVDLIINNNTTKRVKESDIRNLNVAILRYELSRRSGFKLKQQEILLPYYKKTNIVTEDEYKTLMDYFSPRIIRTFTLRVYHESEDKSSNFRDNFLKYYSNVTNYTEFQVIKENLDLLVDTFTVYVEREVLNENREYEEFLNREV